MFDPPSEIRIGIGDDVDAFQSVAPFKGEGIPQAVSGRVCGRANSFPAVQPAAYALKDMSCVRVPQCRFA
jgi:hypothetical protein